MSMLIFHSGRDVREAEAFEVCEYSRELAGTVKLFPIVLDQLQPRPTIYETHNSPLDSWMSDRMLR